MDKQETEPTIANTDLDKFGFSDNTVVLRCRVCGELIRRTIGTKIHGTPVKYGVCRKWSHGASIVKV